MKILKAVLNTIVNILIVLVLVISVVFATIAISSKNSGLPTIFGYTVQPILTSSMDGGNDQYKGEVNKHDLIFCKATNFDEKAVYEVGDIITYKGDIPDVADDTLICHRIVETAEREGMTVYRTKGDNSDFDQYEVADYLASYSIASVYYSDDYHGFKIPYLGYAFTKDGFFFCILLPMIAFFLYILVRVVIDAVNYSNAKKEEKQKKEKEEKDELQSAASNMTDDELEQFKAFMASRKGESDDDSTDEKEEKSE